MPSVYEQYSSASAREQPAATAALPGKLTDEFLNTLTLAVIAFGRDEVVHALVL